ncbi:cation diffusion facilitator family transporter [Sporosarcina highlanderae]|uniref:Cation diffusion facilitator family transporter n=1 Tax=Sporosarcina highlanderae TaxID=3035916 RepID=A0ABT8JVA0_9BACL|nr:cation diffusion facilitator family transporter [Sporosarcina highlanderae]MDN4609098.1 cation diffusion facilitator family transporter [Sporosarcina highlanderae]
MKDILRLLKDGNKPSLLAAIVNTGIAILKTIAYVLTGNVAMFAETMHSLGDAANQFFVYIGSALSKKAPTPKYPNGFGRVVNLVCLGAVIIVGIMSYEAVKEGWHHVLNPVETTGLLINLGVLGLATLLEFFVLLKASKEIAHESGQPHSGLKAFFYSLTHLNRAKPATKLVFMEDMVATIGGLLAFIAVLIAHFTGFLQAEGIASMLIGFMMFYVVGKIFLENARGAIGETDEEMLNHIALIVAEDPDIKDIQKVEVIKEGEFLHVEVIAEVDPKQTVAYIDDVRDRLMKLVLKQKGVREALISFDEDDGIKTWQGVNEHAMSEETRKKLPKNKK